jgi:protein gp37
LVSTETPRDGHLRSVNLGDTWSKNRTTTNSHMGDLLHSRIASHLLSDRYQCGERLLVGIQIVVPWQILTREPGLLPVISSPCALKNV